MILVNMQQQQHYSNSTIAASSCINTYISDKLGVSMDACVMIVEGPVGTASSSPVELRLLLHTMLRAAALQVLLLVISGERSGQRY